MRPGEKALQAVARAEAAQGPEQLAQVALAALYAAEQTALVAQQKVEKARADLKTILETLPVKSVDLEGGRWRADIRTVSDTRFKADEILNLLQSDEYERATKPAIDRDGLRHVQDERLASGRDPLPIVVVQEERMYVSFQGAPRAKRPPESRAGRASSIPESAIAKASENEWVVASSSGSGTYTVRLDGEPATGTWSCTCPDSMQRSGPNCKHAIRVRELVARGHFGEGV